LFFKFISKQNVRIRNAWTSLRWLVKLNTLINQHTLDRNFLICRITLKANV